MLNESNFSKKLVLVAGVVLVLLLAWQLVDLLLLVFASVLVAIFFRALADVIAKPTALSPGWSLAIAVLLVAALAVLITVLFGATIRQNVDTLVEQLPAAWRAARNRIGEAAWLTSAIERGGQALLSGNVVSRIGGALGAALGAIINLFLVLFAGLYIAAQPSLYRDGFLKLVPPQDRDRIDATVTRCGAALRYWLLGQLIAMVVVGVLTWVGLALLAVPSALALGLFAGLAEFVPILGPIAAAIPALIIALSQDTQLALWVLALFMVIQQLEGNLLQPIIQRKMVALPPAVTLFAVLAFAILFGAMGVLLAAPLAVVTLVVVQDLYVAAIEQTASDGHDSA
jgi:predicted PurR-regulated permease PerM